MYLSGYGACVNVRTSSMNLARLTIGPMLAKSIQTGELLPPEAAEVRSARALAPSLQSGPRPARRLRRRRPTPSRLTGRTSPRIACPPLDAAGRAPAEALLLPGGGAPATTRPSNHRPDPIPDSNYDPDPDPDH